MKADTPIVPTSGPGGNRCHPSTRNRLTRAIVKVELVANILEEAGEADDSLRPALSILSSEARTVADKARMVLRLAA